MSINVDVAGMNILSGLLVPRNMTSSICDAIDTEFTLMKEIDQYLLSSTTANIEDGLKFYPHIRAIYEKYNCIRSTEAICERLFSYAGEC